MSGEVAIPRPRGRVGRAIGGALAWSLVGAVGVVTAVAAVYGSGGGIVLAAAVPALLVAAAYAVWRMPLRASGAGLVFLTLALDTSTDTLAMQAYRPFHVWKSPVAFLGDVLGDNLERTVLPGVKLSGLELALILLFALMVYRRAEHVTVDGGARVQTATILRDFVLVYLASLAFAVANGLATGGSFLIWQVRPYLQIPVLFFVFQAVFRGPADHALVGRTIVAAALVKAALSVWVRYAVPLPEGAELVTTTNHGDSLLFVAAILVLVTTFVERPDRHRAGWMVGLVPLLLWGMESNRRRIAWVELGLALAVVYHLVPWRAVKRRFTRLLVVATPLLLLYVGVGWNRGSSLFAPVAVFRSLLDAREDASTYWRDVENWNISMALRDHPILGLGMGKPYPEVIRNDDLTSVYSEWRYQPHNAILGLLLFGGLLAFTGTWTLFAVVIYMAVRSYRHAREADDRAAALCAVGVVVACIIQAYGDIGPPFPQYRIFLALALALTGKLAVATGAWPARGRRPRATAAPALARPSPGP